jgi:Domain of unknown function (DUF4276)
MICAYELVFLLEEDSMKETLEIILPKIVPQEIIYKCIAHEGKSDLEASIPRKLKGWSRPAKFIIVRDKDSADCYQIKQQLVEVSKQCNRPDTLIRIACHELESWFLGDLQAVEQGLKLKQGKVSRLQNKEKYRNPDTIACPKQELRKIDSSYQPISGSRAIANYLNIENNKSYSFNVFIQGMKKLLNEISINY